MEITNVTTIELENAEIAALQTIKDAYITCVTNDCFSCEDCPLYFDERCIGRLAELILYEQEKGAK